MRTKLALFQIIISLIIINFTFSGCTMIFQKGRRVDVEKISKLKSELSDLERAKKELEERLRKEIADKDVKVEMMDRGLVVTFVAEVLFDSGKADLRSQSFATLDKVASVLNTTVKDLNVGVEGHTDDEPIKRSGWKSNWELSANRALSVLHYLIDKQNLSPQRLSISGFGEFHPVISNATKEGRQKNRRVEIVILPKTTKEGRE
ncbi:MAG TPA: flagellar motor protein MotB [Candidatus Omnitrophota bacterium]|nr:flagellar motor protein MotB [Candidatus Omnitrophota bacterium]